MNILEKTDNRRPAMAPEIRDAINAIEKPEVQAMIRELGNYGLGVYVPHMHTRELAFSNLPNELIQVEENQTIRWDRRADRAPTDLGIPVAWRWQGEGSHASAECIQTCSWNADKGTYYKDHL